MYPVDNRKHVDWQLFDLSVITPNAPQARLCFIYRAKHLNLESGSVERWFSSANSSA